ncbi:MAG: hypothetical protein EA428_07705 [Spirochaetaceae bacterium]|nr:MAG: hypothetical protein EA428_07705 [Spirochaetaceae bacterium]
MRSFRFRLEPILSVRSHRAKQAEIELARVTGECLKLEREIAELGHRRTTTYSISVAAEDLSFRVSQGRHISFLEQRMEELRRRRTQMEPKRVEAQSRYNELSKQEKVLEKLRERRSGDHYREYRRHEGRVSDESASQIHVMRKSERQDSGEGDE